MKMGSIMGPPSPEPGATYPLVPPVSAQGHTGKAQAHATFWNCAFVNCFMDLCVLLSLGQVTLEKEIVNLSLVKYRSKKIIKIDIELEERLLADATQTLWMCHVCYTDAVQNAKLKARFLGVVQAVKWVCKRQWTMSLTVNALSLPLHLQPIGKHPTFLLVSTISMWQTWLVHSLKMALCQGVKYWCDQVHSISSQSYAWSGRSLFLSKSR